MRYGEIKVNRKPHPRNTCVFCGKRILKSHNKSREHVIHRSWLKRLGYVEVPIFTDQQEGFHTKSKRSHSADNLLAGNVCGECNSGWMNQLDKDVEDLFFRFLSGLSVEHTPIEMKVPLARFIFKTALAFMAVYSPVIPHILESDWRRAKEASYFPNGFVAFSTVDPSRRLPIQIAHLEVWGQDFTTEENYFQLWQSSHTKFAFAIGTLVLGCVVADVPNTSIVLPEGLNVIHVNNAQISEDFAEFIDLPPDYVQCLIHNILAFIRLRHN